MHVEEMLRQINNNSTELTPWESDFISSINDMELRFVTKHQATKLEEIHDRIFG